jgi:hypothetical protein
MESQRHFWLKTGKDGLDDLLLEILRQKLIAFSIRMKLVR